MDPGLPSHMCTISAPHTDWEASPANCLQLMRSHNGSEAAVPAAATRARWNVPRLTAEDDNHKTQIIFYMFLWS